MGGWGLKLPNTVRILKSVGNIGRSLTYNDGVMYSLSDLKKSKLYQADNTRTEPLLVKQIIFRSNHNSVGK